MCTTLETSHKEKVENEYELQQCGFSRLDKHEYPQHYRWRARTTKKVNVQKRMDLTERTKDRQQRQRDEG